VSGQEFINHAALVGFLNGVALAETIEEINVSAGEALQALGAIASDGEFVD
jgi:hypothetical protein